jgi:hypothetical protein
MMLGTDMVILIYIFLVKGVTGAHTRQADGYYAVFRVVEGQDE